MKTFLLDERWYESNFFGPRCHRQPSHDGCGPGGASIQSRVRAVVYAFLSVTTFAVIAGRSRQGQDQQQQSATAKSMHHEYGRWLVGLGGLIVVAVGVGMIEAGVTRNSRSSCP